MQSRQIPAESGSLRGKPVAGHEMDDPQRDGHAAEENRRAVIPVGHRRRDRRVRRPDQRPSERQRKWQRIRRDVAQRRLHIQTVAANRHRDTDRGDDRSRQSLPDCAFSAGQRRREQYQQGRPQVVDEADFDGLRGGRGEADGQGNRRLVGDEHDTAEQQVAAGRLGERFGAAGEQQHDTTGRVDQGGAERDSERVRGEPHEPGHESPQHDGEQTDHRAAM